MRFSIGLNRARYDFKILLTFGNIPRMTRRYQSYLNGPEWAVKRRQRMSMDDFKCVACKSTKRISVHHLTYARIFSEEMSDLITLCGKCHKRAELLIRYQYIEREGDSDSLRLKTINYLNNPHNTKRIRTYIEEMLDLDAPSNPSARPKTKPFPVGPKRREFKRYPKMEDAPIVKMNSGCIVFAPYR